MANRAPTEPPKSIIISEELSSIELNNSKANSSLEIPQTDPKEAIGIIGAGLILMLLATTVPTWLTTEATIDRFGDNEQEALIGFRHITLEDCEYSFCSDSNRQSSAGLYKSCYDHFMSVSGGDEWYVDNICDTWRGLKFAGNAATVSLLSALLMFVYPIIKFKKLDEILSNKQSHSLMFIAGIMVPFSFVVWFMFIPGELKGGATFGLGGWIATLSSILSVVGAVKLHRSADK